MNSCRIIYVVTCLTCFLGFVGCYELVFRAEDERNIRGQFRVPKSVEVVSFDSHPKQAGFFGREGLRISAVFHFDDKQLGDYMRMIEDKAAWKPVPFLSYSPSRADEYSGTALQWFDLPAPSWAWKAVSNWQHAHEAQMVTNGTYYGSVIVTRRGDRIEHPNGGHHYEWKYIGRSCSEFSEYPSSVILTFGVLDVETSTLYTYIAFSG